MDVRNYCSLAVAALTLVSTVCVSATAIRQLPDSFNHDKPVPRHSSNFRPNWPCGNRCRSASTEGVVRRRNRTMFPSTALLTQLSQKGWSSHHTTRPSDGPTPGFPVFSPWQDARVKPDRTEGNQ